MTTIGVLVGSLSQHAYSQRLADHVMQTPCAAKFVQLNYDLLPLYNPDLETEPILEWQVFRSVVAQMDALLIVTPEYNFSVPGGLKNAIDVLSVASSAPVHQPVLVVTASAGDRGGANANAHLQQLLRYMGMDVVNDWLTIGHVQADFDSQNRLVNPRVTQQLEQAVAHLLAAIK